MGHLNVVVTLVVVLVVTTCSRAQEGRVCTAVNGQAGQCTSIRNCQPLRELLWSVRNNTAGPNALLRLRESICSIENNEPLVCCSIPSSSIPGPTASGRDLLPSRCGLTGITDHIIGGEDAPLRVWPWMALLRGHLNSEPERSVWLCGGVLINSRYVLTAAHCLPGTSTTLEYVRLGEHTLLNDPDCQGGMCAPSPQNILVEQIINHPQYQSPCRHCNDISLLRLSTPAKLVHHYVEPICLPVDPLEDMGFPEEEFQGKLAWAAGWGSVSKDPHRPQNARTLQQVLLPIEEARFCSRLRAGNPNDSATLCAGGRGQDTCKGDSGGPLVLSNMGETKRFVVGITSLGPEVCGLANSQGLYSSVHYYVPWILKTIRP